jgi:protein TonB
MNLMSSMARGSRLCGVALGAWLMGTAAAQAEAQPDVAQAAPLSARDVDWQHRPTGEDFAKAYPRQAAAQNINGAATLTCRISTDRTLEACEVTDETPAGMGFGNAASKLAGKFRLKPEQHDARATPGAQVVLELGFRVWR